MADRRSAAGTAISPICQLLSVARTARPRSLRPGRSRQLIARLRRRCAGHRLNRHLLPLAYRYTPSATAHKRTRAGSSAWSDRAEWRSVNLPPPRCFGGTFRGRGGDTPHKPTLRHCPGPFPIHVLQHCTPVRHCSSREILLCYADFPVFRPCRLTACPYSPYGSTSVSCDGHRAVGADMAFRLHGVCTRAKRKGCEQELAALQCCVTCDCLD